MPAWPPCLEKRGGCWNAYLEMFLQFDCSIRHYYGIDNRKSGQACQSEFLKGGLTIKAKRRKGKGLLASADSPSLPGLNVQCAGHQVADHFGKL